MIANREIRALISAKGVRQWEVAVAMGIREETLSRMLRTELPQEKKEDILKTLEGMGGKWDA